MLTSSAKAKGRRLQFQVAELLSKEFALTIEANPPTRPGERKNGAVYISETDALADLRVRRMGEAGSDVALLSTTAKERVCQRDVYWAGSGNPHAPLWIECKNTEAWNFDANFWKTGANAFVDAAMHQINHAMPSKWRPLLVLGRNRWEPLAVWFPTEEEEKILLPCSSVFMKYAGLGVVPLIVFVKMIRRGVQW